jgi:hypothetical protein
MPRHHQTVAVPTLRQQGFSITSEDAGQFLGWGTPRVEERLPENLNEIDVGRGRV